MKRVFILITALMVLAVGQAQAQVMLSEDEVSISGVVTDVGIETFTVQTGTSTFNIDTSELGIDDTLDDIIVEGLEVQVAGSLNESTFLNPTIEAEQIRILGQYRTRDPAYLFLDGN